MRHKQPDSHVRRREPNSVELRGRAGRKHARGGGAQRRSAPVAGWNIVWVWSAGRARQRSWSTQVWRKRRGWRWLQQVRCTFNHLSHYLTICLTTKLFLLRPLKLNQKIIPVLLLIFLSFLFAWYLSVSPRADLFSSTLSCNKKEEKNHQTSQQGSEPLANQVSNKGASPLPIK